MHLDKNDLTGLTNYSCSIGIITANESIDSAEKPGEGNMNYTLRLRNGNKSFIIKQARPYVEKYPQIPAPTQRAIVEAAFYDLIKDNHIISNLMPRLLATDEENYILAIEDLGEATDCTYLYKENKNLTESDVNDLCNYLTALHHDFIKKSSDELMANRGLRALNHEHIFVYPLSSDNGLNLDTIQPGLQELANEYKNNQQLKNAAAELGKIYLQDGDTLLHGDFYPGSWLYTKDGIKIIDPEFSFYGPAEFDVAVMKAHFIMTLQPSFFTDNLFDKYKKPVNFNEELFNAFTGIEIIRRIIGLAQLPLSLSLQQKAGMLKEAAHLMNIK